MDDKAPFNPNIAAALDIPEPKVISSVHITILL